MLCESPHPLDDDTALPAPRRAPLRLVRLLLVAACTALAAGAAPAVGSAASHVTLRPTADAEVQARAPVGTFGTRPTMRVDAAPKLGDSGLVRRIAGCPITEPGVSVA